MNSISLKNFVINLFLLTFSALLTSGCMKDRLPTEPVEIERPVVRAALPDAGSLNVAQQTPITIAFDKPMNLPSFAGHFKLTDTDGSMAETVITGKDTTVIFTPAAALKKATIYTGELRGRVRDYHNNSIGVNNEGVFDDTTLLASLWFYTAGDYSNGGYYPVYSRDRKAGTIRVLNFLDTVVASFTGLNAPEGFAVSTDGQSLVVSNSGANQVLILNSTTGAVEATIAVPLHPSTVVINGNYAWVICVDGKSLCKIDIAAKSLLTKYTLPVYPGKLAISNDGNTLYTFDQVKRDLYVLNAADASTKKTFPVTSTKLVSGEIITDPVTGIVYICDSKGYAIKALDAGGTTLTSVITFPSMEPVDLTADAAYLYVAAGTSVYKYDKTSNALIKKISFPTVVKSVRVISSDDLLYVGLASSVALVDVKTLKLLKETDLSSSGLELMIAGPNKR